MDRLRGDGSLRQEVAVEVTRGRQSNGQSWCFIREESGEGRVRGDPRLWLEQQNELH